MTETDGAIGIDVAVSGVRALYLQRGRDGSTVAGYSASKNVGNAPSASLILSLIDAIDAPKTTPVALAWDETSIPKATRDRIVAELEQAGYELSTETREKAEARSLPRGDDGSDQVALVQCRIPPVLLTSQRGLTPRTLAGAAGAALGVLGLGQSGGSSPLTASDAPPAPSPSPVGSLTASDAPPAPPPSPVGSLTASDAPPAPPPSPVGSLTASDAPPAPPERRAPRAPKPVATVSSALVKPPPAGAPPAPPAPKPAAPTTNGLTDSTPPDAAGSTLIATPSTAPSPAASSSSRRGPRAWMVFPLLATLFVVGLVLGQWTSSEESVQPASAAVPVPTQVPTAVPEPTSTPEPVVTAVPEPTPNAEPTPAPVDQFPPLSDLPEQAAIFRPPTLFLQGPVSSQATIDVIHSRAAEALGEANVVNEYVVHPDAPPFETGNTIRVEAALLFESGSAEVGPDFIDVLELARLLFELNPQMTGTIKGHTDLIGDDEPNQILSERRANVVRDYLITRGLEAERISAVGFGSSQPVADNETEQGRQQNRRIEFDLNGLLDPRPS